MAQKIGLETKLYVQISAVMTEVTKVIDVEVPWSRSEIENDTRANGVWTGRRTGKGTWGITFSMTRDPSDTTWAQFRTSFVANSAVNIEVRDAAAGDGISGEVYVSDFSDSQPQDGMVTTSVVLIGNGTPTVLT